ncbi:MAG: hypothetical protein U0237_13415 [Thermoleophilia bacterium]
MNYAQRAGLVLASSAVALLVAALIFDRFTISALGFPIVVIIFTLVSLVAKPLTESLVRQHAREIYWATGLIATWVTLLVTDLVSDGIQIEGIGTWVFSTVIVWVSVIGANAVADALGDGSAKKAA